MDISSLINKFSNLNQLVADIKYNAEDTSWQHTTKTLYDFIKAEEKELGFPSPKNSLSRLHVNNLTSEQVWQQLELHNEALIPDYSSKNVMNASSLCMLVAKLSNKLQEEQQTIESESDDEGVETGDESVDRNSPVETEFTEEYLTDDQDNENQEDELSEFSDLDTDTFGDIALEGEESDDDNEDQTNEGRQESKLNQLQQKKFKKTVADTQFFNVRESEWVADNDLIGQDELSDIDLMEDDAVASENEEDNAMYNSFFDPPAENVSEANEKVDEEMDAAPDDGHLTTGLTSKQAISEFDHIMKRQIQQQENLEEDFYLTEKPWMMKGEVSKDQRPENSALEEPLEYMVAVRQKPIITEETTKNIERLLLSRIRTQAWDDVEKRVKPQKDPFSYKKQLILDQEKSKKSLAEIYEEDFLKKIEQGGSAAPTVSSILAESDDKLGEELAIHKEIKKEMEDLFEKLDTLSNYHFTPKFKDAEVKVISNLPSVAIEESTPTTVSDATLLAPQEIVAPLRGDLKGDSEKTSTDKKRARRVKKKIQKLKSERQEQKLKSQLKKSKDRGGLMDKDTSVQLVQKAFKKGQVKALEKEGGQSSNSSQSFFKQLQTNSVAQKKRKFAGESDTPPTKKKSKKTNSIAKLLL